MIYGTAPVNECDDADDDDDDDADADADTSEGGAVVVVVVVVVGVSPASLSPEGCLNALLRLLSPASVDAVEEPEPEPAPDKTADDETDDGAGAASEGGSRVGGINAAATAVPGGRGGGGPGV